MLRLEVSCMLNVQQLWPRTSSFLVLKVAECLLAVCGFYGGKGVLKCRKIHAMSKPQCVFMLPGLTCFPTNQQGKEEAVGGEQPAAPHQHQCYSSTNMKSSSGFVIIFLSHKS